MTAGDRGDQVTKCGCRADRMIFRLVRKVPALGQTASWWFLQDTRNDGIRSDDEDDADVSAISSYCVCRNGHEIASLLLTRLW